ncbi:(Fe-S)-binding protein [Kurthia huakuii]|uniref:(Fe-S)-binding protein n=1 Tax=Kurthia huakuii TaxID=1421019 RepID=UPI0004968B36|nr:(Fe-S)-binding protein [Kurthia huakuii]MBM7698192.1 L-lactate dehydrogenase complex protein LldE [Kurthia huakuii]
MKVALFATCLVDVFQTNVGKATVELLESLGCDVTFPKGQVCCGQPAYNSGYIRDAKEPMRHMIDTFLHEPCIVTPSGSCATMFKEYPRIFADEPIYAKKAQLVADKTYELTEFLVNVLKVTDVGASFPHRVTYHTSCHMTRLLGVKEEPYILLEHVKGLELVALPNAHNCCGFGGTFSVKMGTISEQMVDEKIDCALQTDADYLIASDGGCMMNINGRLHRRGDKLTTLHIAEVLTQHEGV